MSDWTPQPRLWGEHVIGEWCGPGGKHLLVTIYSRPWWNWFRKTNEIRCFECDLSVIEPHE